jgi:enoyl-CoA hydratase
MEMLLCADLIPASRAFEMGLLNAVVPREALLPTAYAFAHRIIENAPLAVQATKQSALQGLYADEMQIAALRRAVGALTDVLADLPADDPLRARSAIDTARQALETLTADLRTALENEQRISGTIFSTEDAKEGPRAFAEKRKPNWQGR